MLLAVAVTRVVYIKKKREIQGLTSECCGSESSLCHVRCLDVEKQFLAGKIATDIYITEKRQNGKTC